VWVFALIGYNFQSQQIKFVLDLACIMMITVSCILVIAVLFRSQIREIIILAKDKACDDINASAGEDKHLKQSMIEDRIVLSSLERSISALFLV
jgi:hypothetical protein